MNLNEVQDCQNIPPISGLMPMQRIDARESYDVCCPFCAEIIKSTAKKCKHCASNLSVDPRQDLTFGEAFDHWIANRTIAKAARVSSARYISERTEWDYRQYARALGKSFAGVKMKHITLESLQEYHRARSVCDGNWGRPCGPNRIRKEVNMLTRMMREFGLWTEELMRLFQPLQPEETDIQRALSPSEQDHFLMVCSTREEWSFIHQYTVAALQTCCSTNELRTLRIGDVALQHGTITIRDEGAKNKYRRRTIPLETGEVIWAFERLLERARSYGATGPQHYLFPFGARGGYAYDPGRPMSDSGLRKTWAVVRGAAGVDWLRPYDLRHTAITRMAESGVPIAIIMSFAGHMSLKMQQHYTSISMMAKRKAIASTWVKAPPRSQAIMPTLQSRPALPGENVLLRSMQIQ